MPVKKRSKIVVVKTHARRVPISKKNPSGRTIVDRHLRHIDGQYLDLNLIEETFKNYDKKKILRPGSEKLLLPNEDKYSEHIAVWENLSGESKDFVFKDIRKRDLKTPNVSLALGVRWLAYKKVYAERILNRAATPDEVIQVYKGILNDKSKKAKDIMEKYREYYEKLKRK